jgi:hypothetical protein
VGGCGCGWGGSLQPEKDGSVAEKKKGARVGVYSMPRRIPKLATRPKNKKWQFFTEEYFIDLPNARLEQSYMVFSEFWCSIMGIGSQTIRDLRLRCGFIPGKGYSRGGGGGA